jgi:hypothetical protein
MIKYSFLGAPILLAVIALSQSALAASDSMLSPWKGGGFGMFSTYDSPSNRFLRLTLTLDGTPPTEVRVPLPRKGAIGDQLRELRTLPSDQAARTALNTLAKSEWLRYPIYQMWTTEQVETDGLGIVLMDGESTPSMGDGEGLRVVGIRMDVLRLRFDAKQNKLVPQPLMRVEATPDEAANAAEKKAAQSPSDNPSTHKHE